MSSREFVGLNIQWPISTLILNLEKSIETRFYPLPSKYVGQDLIFIETPGPNGDFESRMVGIIRFGESFEYKSKKQFHKDRKLHRVEEGSLWDWKHGKTKWGWPIQELRAFSNSVSVGKKRGIVFRTGIILPKNIKFSI